MNHMSESAAIRLKNVTRIGLIAGEGLLPVHVARNATRRGIDVVPFVIGEENRKQLKAACSGALHRITPGLVERNLALLKQEQIHHIVFAGKVDKWVLLRKPRLDARAIEGMKQLVRLNDDAVMLWLIRELEKEGLSVLRQTDFLDNLFLPEKTLTQKHPADEDWWDIAYGFDMAREMGRLDIGQTVVVRQGMVIAVEAIEGTDECLKRAGKLTGKKGGVVVKMAKPDQDQRFDVPTVGLRTLKVMRRAGLHCLATEAGATLFLEPEEMIAYADRHGMIIISVTPGNRKASS